MKSILISNLNNLGDVICSTAALDLLRRNYRGIRIGFLVRSDAEGIIRGNPVVDTLHVYRYRSGSSLRSIWDMAKEIQAENYEVYLSLDRKSRSALVAWLAGIKARIAPDYLHLASKPRWWLPYLFGRVLRLERDGYKSLVDMFEEPVRRAFRLQGKGRTSLPPLTPENRANADRLLAAAGDRPIVGFSVRANADTKNWLPERFAQLMDRLEDAAGAFIYVTGAPGDREYIAAIAAMRKGGSTANLAGETTLMDTAALAARSDLFITLDTGAVHVAGNSGIENLICIFTSTIPEGVLESARQAKVFWTGELCCPCAECPYPQEEAPCRTGITVEMVFYEAMRLLGKDVAPTAADFESVDGMGS